MKCARCGAKVKDLYSPDWVCLACLSPEVKKQYKMKDGKGSK